MFIDSIKLAAFSLLLVPSVACVGLMPPPTATPQGNEATGGQSAEEASASEATASDATASNASTPEANAESGTYVPEGKTWTKVSLAECLPVYRSCLENMPEEERGDLGVPYKHHLTSLKFMESGKMDQEVATGNCNLFMYAFKQANKC
ncbi:MAG: hypothetical protein R3B07_31830 [Polyangiaceae bacterium]